MTILTFRLTAVAIVLGWLWAFLGFQLDGAALTLARATILGLGVVLAAVVIKGNRRACLSVLGLAYLMVFAVLAASQTPLLSGGGVRMVVVDIDGQPLAQQVRLVPNASGLEAELQSMMQLAQALSTPLALPDDPQHVGRAVFSPAGLGEF